ncbi:MAG: transporter [Nitrospirota bacterium]
MKRYFLLFILIILMFLSLYKNSHGYDFDITGLQPVAPYGVFSTFSTESLSKGKVALSAGAEISKEPDFYRFLFKTAYGVTDNIEFNMTIPYIYNWANSMDGLEDIALGFKHRFFDEGKYGPSMAYILNGSISSGRDEFSTDGRFGVGLIVSKKVGPFNGHANLFYEKPWTGRLDEEVSFATGLDFAAAHNFKILAELYFRKSHYSTEFDSIEGRVGYRIKTTDMIYTTFGAGFDLKNRSPEYRIMFSVTFLTPQEKKEIKKVYEEE